VDAWGKAFRLRVVGTSPNQTWQVYSLGVNGIDESAGGDDLVYPAVPTLASTYESVLNFNIANPNSRTISVTAYSRQGSASLSTITSGSFTSSSIPTQVYNLWSGGIAIRITVTGASPATYYYVVDLLPGEVRDFSVTVP
jgi:hypothetical protein